MLYFNLNPAVIQLLLQKFAESLPAADRPPQAAAHVRAALVHLHQRQRADEEQQGDEEQLSYCTHRSLFPLSYLVSRSLCVPLLSCVFFPFSFPPCACRASIPRFQRVRKNFPKIHRRIPAIRDIIAVVADLQQHVLGRKPLIVAVAAFEDPAGEAVVVFSAVRFIALMN